MNDIEKANCASSFVCLKVSYEVPPRSLSSQFYYFFFCFPHAVLTKISHARFDSRAQGFGWMRFADCNQGYLLRQTVAAPRGCLNTVANVREPFA